MGRMHERRGAVEQEGLSGLLLPVEEFECRAFEPVGTVGRIFVMTVVVHHAVGVAVGAGRTVELLVHIELEKAPLVPSQARGHPAVASELPLAEHPGRIAGLPGQLGEVGFVVIHIAEADVVAVVVLTGHQLHARGRTQRLGVHIGEEQAVAGQRIDRVRVVGDAAHAAETFGADVVRQKQHDVGTRIVLYRSVRTGTGRKRQCRKTGKTKCGSVHDFTICWFGFR